MKPVLSICIPTYNRLSYLRELVGSLLPQIDRTKSGAIEILVSNNVSTDGTAAFCETISRPYFRFWTNEVNIGGDRNFLKCIREAKGTYVWLVGDDDLVPEGAIAKVLAIINGSHPDLIASMDEKSGPDGSYSSYGEFLGDRCRHSPWPALCHTLISANVFRRDIFDADFAEEKLYTQYAHMFGLVKNLCGKIEILRELIKTRSVRADFAKFPSNLCVKQSIYMRYLAERFNQPQFRRFAFFCACNLPLEYASRLKNYFKRILMEHSHE